MHYYTSLHKVDYAVITVPTFNSCTECVGSPGMIHDCRLDFTQCPGHKYMVDLTTERNFDSQATCVIDVLGLYF